MAINKTKVLAQADKYIAKQNFNKALNELLKVEKATPNDINLLNKIGDLYSKTGNSKEAIGYFLRVADSYKAGGFNLKAIAVLKKVVRIDARFMDARDRLVELYTQQGHHSEAKAELRRMAEHYHRENLPARALDCYQKMLNLDASNLDARIKIAELLVHEGRKDEAAHHFEVMGRDLLQKKMINEAQKIIGQGLKIDAKNPRLQTIMAQTCLAEGKTDKALEQLTQICRDNPNDLDAVKTLGRVYLDRGRLKDANACFLRALHISEDEIGSVEEVIQQFIQAGELDEACRAIQPVSDIFRRRGQHEEAVRLYRSALYVEENHILSLEALAAIYEESGQAANALLTLEKLIGIHQERHDREKQRETIAKLLELDPDNPEWRSKLQGLDGGPGSTPESGDAFAGFDEDDAALAASFEASVETGKGDQDEDRETRIANHLTEAEISLKYGIVDQAIEHLQAVKELEFLHVDANAKLKDIYLERGEIDQAVGCMVCLINAYLEREDMDGAGALVVEIGKHRPDIAEIHRNRLEAANASASSASQVIEFNLDSPTGSELEEKPNKAGEVDMGFDSSDDVDVVDFSKLDAPKEGVFDAEAAETSATSWSLDMPHLSGASGEAGGKVDDLKSMFRDQAEHVESWDVDEALDLAARSSEETPSFDFEGPDQFSFDAPAEPEADLAPPDAPETTPELDAPSEPEATTEPDTAEPEATTEPDTAEPEATTEPDESAEPAEPEAAIEPDEPAEPEAAIEPDEPAEPEVAIEPDAPAEPELDTPELALEEPPDFDALEASISMEMDDSASEPQLEPDEGEDRPQSIDDTLPTEEVDGVFPPKAPFVQADAEAEAAAEDDDEDLATDPDQKPIFSGEEESPAQPQHAPLGSEQGSLASELEEIDFFISVEAFDDAQKLIEEAIKRFGEHPLLSERVQEVEAKTQAAVKTAGSPKGVEEDDPEALAAEDADLFDLAAELSDAIFEDEPGEVNDNPSQDEFQSVEELFQEFKKGVEDQIDKDDHQTHYDLGIAYKEMGLLEEAIHEFQTAMRDPARFLECAAMIGNCLVELGRPEEAISHYKQALEGEQANLEARLALRYELGRTFEGAGELEKALEQFQSIKVADPTYRDVGERISALQ